jgi:hypothetical protein
MKGDPMAALDALIEALENQMDAWRRVGSDAFREGRTTEARGMLLRVEQAEPIFVEVQKIKSRILPLLEDGDFTPALPALQSSESHAQERTDFAVLSSYRDRVVKALGRDLGTNLKRHRGATAYTSDEGTTRVVLMVSKNYSGRNIYWYGFHEKDKEFAEGARNSRIALGMLDREFAVALPIAVLLGILDDLNTTEDERRKYWHLHISGDTESGVRLLRKRGKAPLDVTQYVIPLAGDRRRR